MFYISEYADGQVLPIAVNYALTAPYVGTSPTGIRRDTP